ncbi:mRNA-decapping enzyme subunit 2, partial [Teratosphaeriaceae sp. CCFEE 6253]
RQIPFPQRQPQHDAFHQQQQRQSLPITSHPSKSGPRTGFNVPQRQQFQPPPPPPQSTAQMPYHLRTEPYPPSRPHSQPQVHLHPHPQAQQQPQPHPFSQPHHQAHPQPPHLAPQFPRSSDAFLLPQGPAGPIADGPAVPKASNLPMPRLDARALGLLNALKSGGSSRPPTTPGVDVGTVQQQQQVRQPSVQQTKLLDLFRRPGAPATMAAMPGESRAEHPTLAAQLGGGDPEGAMAPGPPQQQQQGRRTTLNEITRTLPGKLKAKSTPPPPPPHARPSPAVLASAPAVAAEGVRGLERVPQTSPRRVLAQSEITALQAATLGPRGEAGVVGAMTPPPIQEARVVQQAPPPPPMEVAERVEGQAGGRQSAPAPPSTRMDVPPPQSLDRPRSRGQLFDPAAPRQAVQIPAAVLQRGLEQRMARDAKPEQSALPVLPRAVGQEQTPRAPGPGRSPRVGHASPSRHAAASASGARGSGAENGAPRAQAQVPVQPAFKILARPGSMRAEMSPGVVDRQELMNGAGVSKEGSKQGRNAASHPDLQMLRRPESVDPTTVQKAAEVVEERGTGGGEGKDKREQLLALFGKSGAAGAEPAASPPVAASPIPPRPSAPTPAAAAEGRKAGLLDPFNAGPAGQRSGNSTPASATTMDAHPPPPPPPQIQPERRPSSNTVIRHDRQQQAPKNLLLDLFNRPSAGKLGVESPGTPISPFTLGTPAHGHAPTSLSALAGGSGYSSDNGTGAKNTIMSGVAQEARRPTPTAATPTTRDPSRDGLGSAASVAEYRKGGAAGTPVETKGFLLSYLNGVVREEGYKGAGAGAGAGLGRK